jgi:hypothetical protein
MSVVASDTVHVLGIRHHGPGSARSVRRSLEELRPDVILLEGPPDANGILPLAAHAGMEPPVALLVYRPDALKEAVFYPFAVFSPEWQGLQYGLTSHVPVRFFDLPQAHQLALREAGRTADPTPHSQEEVDRESEGLTEPEAEPAPDDLLELLEVRRDPLQWLAEAAGHRDGERWWEAMIEHRRDSSGVFVAIQEAMTALRESMPPAVGGSGCGHRMEHLREAHMRQSIRAAEREGFTRIAVICGAWHAPVLSKAAMPPAKEDAAVLKGLPKVKVQATWIPWTHGRLCAESGYGAGVESPGWYHHLWVSEDQIVGRWMTRVARLLREQDLEASSAHVIEAVRLAETLASLRGSSVPGLPELNEAILTVFGFGDDRPLRLVREKLIVGEVLGRVPDDTAAVPLQHDLAQHQKRLRLPPDASVKDKDLDLREPTDLQRSVLLHRLNLLGIAWGTIGQAQGKGTFKERWRLQWQPEFAVAVIEAGLWGNTVEAAAAARTRDAADHAADLPGLTGLLETALLADLPEVVEHVMSRVQSEAALASDVTHLMGALPPLASVLRYGNVRQTDTAMVAHAVAGLVARIAISLPGACGSLNAEAAAAMDSHIVGAHTAIALLQNPDHQATWNATLARLVDQPGLHGLIAGRCCRLLLELGAIDAPEAARRLSLALSTASEPAQASAWIEGLLKGSGLLLLHDEILWDVIDQWVTALHGETFTSLLPLLRRTFATFPAPERRQMGARVRRGTTRAHGPATGKAASPAAFDTQRAEAVLPLLARLLGVALEETRE